jgi:hypothetical protein
MTPGEEAHIRGHFGETSVIAEPFAHIFVREVLPWAVYHDMETAQPSIAECKRAAFARAWKPARLASRLKFWRPLSPADALFYISRQRIPADGLERYSSLWMERFGPYIELISVLAHQKLGAPEYNVGQWVFMWRPSGWAITAHRHGEEELLNALLYFPSSENTQMQGTILYRQRKAGLADFAKMPAMKDIEPAVSVPYLPNCLVAWLNGPNTFHGSAEIPGSAARRYLYMNSTRAA